MIIENKDRFKFRLWIGCHNKMVYEFDQFSDSFQLGDRLEFSSLGWEYRDFWDNPINLKDMVLLQSTGLRDKNNKLIFEGDLLKDSDGALIQIECFLMIILKKLMR